MATRILARCGSSPMAETITNKKSSTKTTPAPPHCSLFFPRCASSSQKALKSPLKKSIIRTQTTTAGGADHPNKDSSPSIEVKHVEAKQPHNQDSSTFVENGNPRAEPIPITVVGLPDPFSPVRTMRQQMMQALEELDDALLKLPNPGEIRAPWETQVDEQEIKMRFDMPGLSKEEVEVFLLGGDVIEIKGERKREESNDYYKDDEVWFSKNYNKYDTRLRLPENCDTGNIKLDFKDGVLYIYVPNKQGKQEIELKIQ